MCHVRLESPPRPSPPSPPSIPLIRSDMSWTVLHLAAAVAGGFVLAGVVELTLALEYLIRGN